MRKPMAFPYEGSGEKQPGMTLRDWYAGMALQGMLANSNIAPLASAPDDPWARYATAAFKIADAMMAEREKRRAARET